ncbi:GspH/FimT family pseudopilin [Luteimonas sp. A537]
MDNMRPAGFTLLELMATLAIAAILAAIAAPGMARAWQRANALQALHATTSSLALARSLAVSRGYPVTLCPSTDATSCTGGRDWSAGWIVFLDPGRSQQPASQAQVVEAAAAIKGSLALRSTAGRMRIRYLPHGWASGSNASLHLCSRDSSQDLLATIVVNNAGRTRTDRPAERQPCPGS